MIRLFVTEDTIVNSTITIDEGDEGGKEFLSTHAELISKALAGDKTAMMDLQWYAVCSGFYADDHEHEGGNVINVEIEGNNE